MTKKKKIENFEKEKREMMSKVKGWLQEFNEGGGDGAEPLWNADSDQNHLK